MSQNHIKNKNLFTLDKNQIGVFVYKNKCVAQALENKLCKHFGIRNKQELSSLALLK